MSNALFFHLYVGRFCRNFCNATNGQFSSKYDAAVPSNVYSCLWELTKTTGVDCRNVTLPNVGHFAYKTFRLLDTSPTTWTLRLLDISPTGQFAYETFRLQDTSPTPWTIRPLNMNTRERKCVTYTMFQKN